MEALQTLPQTLRLTASSREPAPRAIILAAGAASRFGSAKQLATLDGIPILQRVIDETVAVSRLKKVVVVLGSEAECIKSQIEFGRAEAVVCGDWQQGISASLRAGLQALDAKLVMTARKPPVLVVLGDLPMLGHRTIDLIARAELPPGGAARAAYRGQPGHPVLLSPELARKARELEGDQGFAPLLKKADVRLVECGHPGCCADVDTPDQLAALIDDLGSSAALARGTSSGLPPKERKFCMVPSALANQAPLTLP